MASSKLRFAVIAGDGIGVEVTDEALRVLDAVASGHGFPVETRAYPYSADHFLETGETLPEPAFQELQTFDAIYMGAFGDPRVPDMRHARDILLGTRFRLDLYINLRPIRCLHESLNPLKHWKASDIDMVVFRENTEGLYVGVGGNFKKGTPHEIAIQEEINTRRGVERIIRAAFEYARDHGRARVTMADKSNALRFGHDLWLRTFHELAAEFDGIESEHMYIDALAMEMIRDPKRLDVIVTCNLFGDIITDLGAQLQGGMGMAGSGNIRPDCTSMFEPVHGSAPPLTGKDVANPFAAILTVAMMLDHCGRGEAAAAIERAISSCIDEGACTTDLGGNLGTRAAGDAVLARLDRTGG